MRFIGALITYNYAFRYIFLEKLESRDDSDGAATFSYNNIIVGI